ncbi:MAG: transcriptional repressor LexA [Rhodospirillales bacterium]|nr:transcriptional repressor LexA [Rhodospirillales bacterium]
MLTRKQYELLMYIDRRLKEAGVSPSFDEMKEALGLKSKSGIHRLITGLVERGFLHRLPHRARALEVIRVPENQRLRERGQPAEVMIPPTMPDPVIARLAAKNTARRGVSDIPLYGRIAAGLPIEALRDESNRIDVPASLLGNGEYYALEVDGDSMIDAGIHDGDTAIIERSETADNGAIVVALVDENEVTLKRLRRKGNSIALEPANKSHETRIFGPDRVKVQGRLFGIIRRY